MRIAVVGSIVADTIEQADGSVSESLGGISHTLAALAAVGGGAHTILPVCRVGADSCDRVEQWADGLAGLSLDGIIADPDDNPRVRLSYREASLAGERVERLSHSLAPLGPEDVEPCLRADLVMINCITGDDCTIEALRLIAKRCDRVYLDVHSLALGRRDDGTRYYRPRDDWSQWLSGIDVVQCNAFEAAGICGLDPDNEADRDCIEDELLSAVRSWWASATHDPERRTTKRGASSRVTRPPGVVVLTLAEKGANVLTRAHGVVSSRVVVAPRVDVVDPTGAGDAFGAGYVCAWLAGAGPFAATRAAVRSGTAACASPGVPGSEAFLRALEVRRAR